MSIARLFCQMRSTQSQGKLHTTLAFNYGNFFFFPSFFYFACLRFTMRTIYLPLGAGVIYFN